jgi:hypothetical protein
VLCCGIGHWIGWVDVGVISSLSALRSGNGNGMMDINGMGSDRASQVAKRRIIPRSPHVVPRSPSSPSTRPSISRII